MDIESTERPDIEVYLGLFERGEIEPEPVLLPPLPKGLTRTERRIVDFFVLDHGLRLATADDGPVPFGGEWVANNLPGRPRLTRRTVSRVLDKLVRLGVLERGDDLRTTNGRLVRDLRPWPRSRPSSDRRRGVKNASSR